MRILLAEDNPELSSWLARLLRRDNYVIDCVLDGEAADEALAMQEYALVILDLSLPRMGGLEVLKHLRQRGRATPVLILTASDSVASRVAGLDAGADDYLAKPFDINELEARIRALLRRGQPAKSLLIEFGPLSFDSNARAFTLNGTALALTPREHAVLEVLMTRAGRVVSKEKLFDEVFSLADDANPDAIEIYIHRLRKKLASDQTGQVAITTLRGLGYLLEAQAE